MFAAFRHTFFLILFSRHVALHQPANQKHAENRNYFIRFSFQSKYLIRFA